MHNHKATQHPDLLIGIPGADDAGVIRISEDESLVQSVDFFTPIVDDPYDWGRITAANALSDLYAMGADPFTALQLVGWPRDDLPFDLLARVIEGGADVMAEAGCVIVGGHSIDDKEPKYGFAVTGRLPTSDVMSNAAAQPGQLLVLTKPIGTGIISTAIKRGLASDTATTDAIDTMTALNRGASDAARRVGITTATDVTGFGLLGHLAEIVRASGVSATVDTDSVPLLSEVRAYAAEGFIPGGTKRNLKSLHPMLESGSRSKEDVLILADAQTSGGLLLAVDAPLVDALIQALDDTGTRGWQIGEVTERSFADGPSGQIRLT